MPYTAIATELPEVLILEPKVFTDHRGAFFESFSVKDFEKATGLARTFVQDNQSTSGRHVLRGLHYQRERCQGKLVRVLRGEIFDVAVDLRPDSPRFRKWTAVRLSGENRRQLWVPEGFGHGFLVTGDTAEVFYKTTDYWFPEHERTVLWSDPALAIDWPLTGSPVLAPRDATAKTLDETG